MFDTLDIFVDNSGSFIDLNLNLNLLDTQEFYFGQSVSARIGADRHFFKRDNQFIKRYYKKNAVLMGTSIIKSKIFLWLKLTKDIGISCYVDVKNAEHVKFLLQPQPSRIPNLMSHYTCKNQLPKYINVLVDFFNLKNLSTQSSILYSQGFHFCQTVYFNQKRSRTTTQGIVLGVCSSGEIWIQGLNYAYAIPLSQVKLVTKDSSGNISTLYLNHIDNWKKLKQGLRIYTWMTTEIIQNYIANKESFVALIETVENFYELLLTAIPQPLTFVQQYNNYYSDWVSQQLIERPEINARWLILLIHRLIDLAIPAHQKVNIIAAVTYVIQHNIQAIPEKNVLLIKQLQRFTTRLQEKYQQNFSLESFCINSVNQRPHLFQYKKYPQYANLNQLSTDLQQHITIQKPLETKKRKRV